MAPIELKHFGQEAAKRRKARGWSRAVLAKKSKTTEGTIQRIESGTVEAPRERTLKQIGRALGMSQNWGPSGGGNGGGGATLRRAAIAAPTRIQPGGGPKTHETVEHMEHFAQLPSPYHQAIATIAKGLVALTAT